MNVYCGTGEYGLPMPLAYSIFAFVFLQKTGSEVTEVCGADETADRQT
jgi:hypothetical protein